MSGGMGPEMQPAPDEHQVPAEGSAWRAKYISYILIKQTLFLAMPISAIKQG